MRYMLIVSGRYPSLYFRFCWLVASPALLLALWVASLVDYTPPSYRQYQYPLWAQILGWTIASLSLLCIPVYAVAVILRSPGENLLQVIYLCDILNHIAIFRLGKLISIENFHTFTMMIDDKSRCVSLKDFLPEIYFRNPIQDK